MGPHAVGHQEKMSPLLEVLLAAGHDGGHGVLVHCFAGLGRTGTILACFLVAQGMDAAEAIAHVRTRRPGSVEVYSQEFLVYQYARMIQEQPEQTDE